MAATGQRDIDWGFVRARRSPDGRAEYLSFLDHMRAYWPEARPLSGEDPSPQRDERTGVRLFGRKEDPTTDTYVVTRVFMWSLLPVIALGAFRVHETGRGGLLFVAREPLPSWARALNVLVGILACVGLALILIRMR
jgi:hypothetical protein